MNDVKPPRCEVRVNTDEIPTPHFVGMLLDELQCDAGVLHNVRVVPVFVRKLLNPPRGEIVKLRQIEPIPVEIWVFS